MFTWQPQGLKAQHREVTCRYESWIDELVLHERSGRIWLQNKRGRLQSAATQADTRR